MALTTASMAKKGHLHRCDASLDLFFTLHAAVEED
jgi:hypothetical protein